MHGLGILAVVNAFIIIILDSNYCNVLIEAKLNHNSLVSYYMHVYKYISQYYLKLS